MTDRSGRSRWLWRMHACGETHLEYTMRGLSGPPLGLRGHQADKTPVASEEQPEETCSKPAKPAHRVWSKKTPENPRKQQLQFVKTLAGFDPQIGGWF